MFRFKALNGRLPVTPQHVLVRLVVALLLMIIGGPMPQRAHAQSEVGWVACPFVFDAATKVLLARLKTKLSPDEFAGMGDLVCTSVKLYRDYQKSRPKQVPLSPQTAHEIFCANSQSLEYCGKTPLVPPSFKQALRQGANETFVGGWAAKCMQTNPTAEGCAAAILNQAIADAEKK
jgi:hypothetical protein